MSSNYVPYKFKNLLAEGEGRIILPQSEINSSWDIYCQGVIELAPALGTIVSPELLPGDEKDLPWFIACTELSKKAFFKTSVTYPSVLGDLGDSLPRATWEEFVFKNKRSRDLTDFYLPSYEFNSLYATLRWGYFLSEEDRNKLSLPNEIISYISHKTAVGELWILSEAVRKLDFSTALPHELEALYVDAMQPFYRLARAYTHGSEELNLNQLRTRFNYIFNTMFAKLSDSDRRLILSFWIKMSPQFVPNLNLEWLGDNNNLTLSDFFTQ